MGSIIKIPKILTGSEAIIKNGSKYNGQKITIIQHRGSFCWVQIKESEKIVKIKTEHLSKIIPPIALEDDADIEKWIVAYRNRKMDN